MKELQKINVQTVDDFLASVRQYIIADDEFHTVLRLPKGTKFIPNMSIIGVRYKRMSYGVSTLNGTTTIVTLYKI